MMQVWMCFPWIPVGRCPKDAVIVPEFLPGFNKNMQDRKKKAAWLPQPGPFARFSSSMRGKQEF